jgi:anti-sigma factor RsiW
MTCAELEILICDYVDGTLGPDARTTVEQHLAGCRNCAELARDGAAAVGFMERAAEVEPPAGVDDAAAVQRRRGPMPGRPPRV